MDDIEQLAAQFGMQLDSSGVGHTSASRLEDLADHAYAEGRKDEREELLAVIRAAGFELITAPSGHQFLLNVQEEGAAIASVEGKS